jgi:hypothetical protein
LKRKKRTGKWDSFNNHSGRITGLFKKRKNRNATGANGIMLNY